MTHTLKRHSLAHLPDELLIEVLQWLEVLELLNARLICRAFSRISRERRLWKGIVEESHVRSHVRPDPPTLDKISTSGLELLGRSSQRLQISWSSDPSTSSTIRECKTATLIRHFAFNTPSISRRHDGGPGFDSGDNAGIWSFVPGGQKLIHISVDLMPSLHIQVLDIDSALDAADVFSLALAKSDGGGGWFQDVCLQPNGKGTGVFLAYLYGEDEEEESCALHIGELLFANPSFDHSSDAHQACPSSQSDASSQFRTINQMTCYLRPTKMQLVGHRAVLVFDDAGSSYLFIWDFLRNQGAFVDSVCSTSQETILNIVNDRLVVTTLQDYSVVVYDIPTPIPHTSLPPKRSGLTKPTFTCHLDRSLLIDIHFFVTCDMWTASDYKDATLLFATLDLNQTALIQCWMSNITFEVVLCGSGLPELPDPASRRLLLSCHVGSSHNTTMMATSQGVQVVHLPNPRGRLHVLGPLEEPGPSLEFEDLGGDPVVIMKEGMFDSLKDSMGGIFSDWSEGQDIRASFDEVTGKVAFAQFGEEDALVAVVDYTI